MEVYPIKRKWFKFFKVYYWLKLSCAYYNNWQHYTMFNWRLIKHWLYISHHSSVIFMLKITAAMVLNIICSALFWYMLLSLSSTSLGISTASSFRCYYKYNYNTRYSYSYYNYICDEYGSVSASYCICSCYNSIIVCSTIL